MPRQGDILIRPAPVPAGEVTVIPRVGGRIILAEGEATGHAHAIAAPEADLVSVSGQVDRWLRARTTVPLEHEEHGTVVNTPGTHRVTRQRQWEGGQSRRVLD